ncbi:hypothetical protein [Acidovorax sp. SUPP2825]|uniref:hypothetical protein n=1 Tax=Acidovorax sp. SUPP2825 TaxID=2920879 RepID=UPI0023DE256A|nr:hypothetical protein [Acidovorax sp. SUPP2825]GKS96087.1 hypothetical protein AVAK2825_16150 [Acidovorax sp. SUPP2825]
MTADRWLRTAAHGTLPLLAALLGACAPLGSTHAQAPAGPDLRADTAARFLAFAPARNPELAMTDAPALAFGVRVPGTSAAAPFTMTMDTGSTGVVVSATDLPGFSEQEAESGVKGWEFLSSSKRLWIGRWVPRELVFRDPAGGEVVARVPVLAVQEEIICPGWSEKANVPTCEKPEKTTAQPRGIAYMGVGFGREHDGQPQGTPDKNPLLNIVSIDGQPVAPGSMRSGFIVTAKGVHVGLTRANTAGFSYVKLQGRSLNAAGQPASSDPRDWPQATMAVSVNGAASQTGAVLVDTGIAQMYLTVANPSALPTTAIPNPSLKGAMATGLVAGTSVQVSFPDDAAPVAQYTFQVGTPQAPTAVIVTRPSAQAFVNTGRHLLRQHDVLFDADGGWFGLRRSE